MINFESIYKSHFNTPRISDNNMQRGAEEHIGRIIANNGSGTFNTILAATQLAYNNYFGKMSSEAIAAAVRESLTASVDVIIKNFKSDVSRYEGAVRTAYGKNSPVYQEFYPQGIDEYQQADKNNIKLLMTRIAAAFNAHSGDFAPAVVTLFTNYPTNFQAGRDAQVQKKGDVDTAKVGTAADRDALEIQLLKNLFFIGFTFPGNVQQCMAFWDQSMFNYDADPDNDGKGQVEGIAKVNGVPVSGIELELDGLPVPVNKFHSKIDGRFRSPKVSDVPVQAILRAKKPGLITQEKTITIDDTGIAHVDFDMQPEP